MFETFFFNFLKIKYDNNYILFKKNVKSKTSCYKTIIFLLNKYKKILKNNLL